jgi:dCMP deaminase
MTWNEYFINIAFEVAKKSKDPSSKVGCVIVDSDHRPISFGYNGFVASCDESLMTFERPLKYNLIIHAEMNALIFAHRSVKNAKAYVTHGPCENCLKHLIQAGIKEIYYKNPGILIKRGSDEQKDAIIRLISSTGAICKNISGVSYIEELTGRPWP